MFYVVLLKFNGVVDIALEIHPLWELARLLSSIMIKARIGSLTITCWLCLDVIPVCGGLGLDNSQASGWFLCASDITPRTLATL